MSFLKEYRTLPQCTTHNELLIYTKTLMKVALSDGLVQCEIEKILDQAVVLQAPGDILEFIKAGVVDEELDELLANFTSSPERVRHLLYRDVFRLVHVDGRVTEIEQGVLADLATQLEIDDGSRLLIERYVHLERELSALSNVLFL